MKGLILPLDYFDTLHGVRGKNLAVEDVAPVCRGVNLFDGFLWSAQHWNLFEQIPKLLFSINSRERPRVKRGNVAALRWSSRSRGGQDLLDRELNPGSIGALTVVEAVPSRDLKL